MYLSTGNSSPTNGDTTKRQDRIRNLMLTSDRFMQMRSAICETLDLFESIIKGGSGHSVTRPISEVLERLEKTEKEKWRNIRTTYLSDPYYGYVNGNFTSSEASDPCKLLMDLVHQCGQAHHDMLEKADELYEKQKEHKAEVRHLQAQLKTTASELKEAEWRCESSREEVLKSRTDIAALHKELSEKREIINSLSRDGTVQIWQKEKERILADSNVKIEQLEAAKAKLQADNDRMVKTMERKLAVVDEKNKMLKMKQELASSKPGTTGINKDEFNKLRNENYLLQKDLTVLEKELQRQQTVFAGVLNGMRKDTLILSQKYKTDKYGEMLDLDVTKLQQRLDSLYAQSLDGKLWTESEKLPFHYKEVDKVEVATTKTKKLSTFGRSGRLSPLQKEVVRPQLTSGQTPSTATLKLNPQIVDVVTGRINSSVAMKHFPAISQDSVREHWEHFTKFDTDGNNALDLQEVLRAIQTTIGFQFSPTQIETCFNEIDEDQSNSIDFFEYLTITQLLINRSGKSEIFQSGVAKTKSTVVSKTCAIQ